MAVALQNRDRASRTVWAVAGLLGVLGMAGWSLLKPITIPGRVPGVEHPRVSYRPIYAEEGDIGHGGALQAVWTPILFSLPTSAGFSRPMLEKTGDALPPAGFSEAVSRVAAVLPQDWTDYMKPLQGADIAHQVRHAQWKYRRSTAPALLPPEGSTSKKAAQEECVIRWVGGIHADMILKKTVNLKGLGGAVRDAVLFVDISPDGIFEHVFVEKSSGDVEWDNRVVSRVRQWRAVPAVAQRSGRLILQSGSYRPGAAPAPEGSAAP